MSAKLILLQRTLRLHQLKSKPQYLGLRVSFRVQDIEDFIGSLGKNWSLQGGHSLPPDAHICPDGKSHPQGGPWGRQIV